MSAIRTIYSNLAGQSVTFTRESGASVTVAARDLHQLPVSVNAADAPIRLILPYSDDTEQRDGVVATMGPVGAVTWYIADLLLWKPGALTSGIAESAADLVRYQGAYASVMLAARTLGVTNGTVALESWRARPGLYDWPIGSSTWWQGVMMILTVAEVVDDR